MTHITVFVSKLIFFYRGATVQQMFSCECRNSWLVLGIWNTWSMSQGPPSPPSDAFFTSEWRESGLCSGDQIRHSSARVPTCLFWSKESTQVTRLHVCVCSVRVCVCVRALEDQISEAALWVSMCVWSRCWLGIDNQRLYTLGWHLKKDYSCRFGTPAQLCLIKVQTNVTLWRSRSYFSRCRPHHISITS